MDKIRDRWEGIFQSMGQAVEGGGGEDGRQSVLVHIISGTDGTAFCNWL